MSFYGNITNVPTNTFTFDKHYANKYELELGAADDNVFIGRYVAIEYDQHYNTEIEEIKDEKGNIIKTSKYYNENNGITIEIEDNKYTIKYHKDPTKEPQVIQVEYEDAEKTILKPYSNYKINAAIDDLVYNETNDSTGWVKEVNATTATYKKIADLNGVVPSFDIALEPPSELPKPMHFDEEINKVAYKLHQQPQWGFRIKEAPKGQHSDVTASKILKYEYNEKNEPYLQIKDSNGNFVKYEEGTENYRQPSDIYFNLEGFKYNIDAYKKDATDSIAILPTGSSDLRYQTHTSEARDTENYEEATANDIYELSIVLPSLGNAVAQMWNVVYGPGDEKTAERNIDLSWENIDDRNDLDTLAGTIKFTHRLLGQIIVTGKVETSDDGTKESKFIFPNGGKKTPSELLDYLNDEAKGEENYKTVRDYIYFIPEDWDGSEDKTGFDWNGSKYKEGYYRLEKKQIDNATTYKFISIPEFATSLNTINGQILNINRILEAGNTQTRDLKTVQGCINKLNDIFDKFETFFIKDRPLSINNKGKISTDKSIDELPLENIVSEMGDYITENDTIGTAFKTLENQNKKTIRLLSNYWEDDEIIMPVKITENGANNSGVISNLSVKNNNIVIERTLGGDLPLIGFSDHSAASGEITSLDTVNSALNKLQNEVNSTLSNIQIEDKELQSNKTIVTDLELSTSLQDKKAKISVTNKEIKDVRIDDTITVGGLKDKVDNIEDNINTNNLTLTNYVRGDEEKEKNEHVANGDSINQALSKLQNQISTASRAEITLGGVGTKGNANPQAQIVTSVEFKDEDSSLYQNVDSVGDLTLDGYKRVTGRGYITFAAYIPEFDSEHTENILKQEKTDFYIFNSTFQQDGLRIQGKKIEKEIEINVYYEYTEDITYTRNYNTTGQWIDNIFWIKNIDVDRTPVPIYFKITRLDADNQLLVAPSGYDFTYTEQEVQDIYKVQTTDSINEAFNKLQTQIDNKDFDTSSLIGQPGAANNAEIFNDYKNNQALGPYTHASGLETQAGITGYYFTDLINISEDGFGEFQLSKTQSSLDKDFVINYKENDIISYVYGSKYLDVATIKEIDNVNKKIKVQSLTKKPLEIGTKGKDIDDQILYVKDKPNAGIIPFGHYACAEGENTQAIERSSHAEGRETIARGQYGHAEGRGTKAGYAAHAEGYKTNAAGNYSHTEGWANNANGQASHAEGRGTNANGLHTHAEGYATTAIGDYSHTEGWANNANGQASHAEGRGTNANGLHTHAEGYATTAIGDYSHTEGQGTIADGEAAHTEGYLSKATNNYAHAEGRETIASGDSSHTEGYLTQAIASTAHAEGNGTQAKESATHAEGYHTVASARFAHAEGRETVANIEQQHVEGKYNKYVDDNGAALNYAHVVGNGTSDSDRSNAHTLDWNGNAWFAGKVTAKDFDSSKINTSRFEANSNINGAKFNGERLISYVGVESASLENTNEDKKYTVVGLEKYSSDKYDMFISIDDAVLIKYYEKIADMGIIPLSDHTLYIREPDDEIINILRFNVTIYRKA